jgi:NADPH:quinone reductase-like Zn-dependent oxidoreductase
MITILLILQAFQSSLVFLDALILGSCHIGSLRSCVEASAALVWRFGIEQALFIRIIKREREDSIEAAVAEAHVAGAGDSRSQSQPSFVSLARRKYIDSHEPNAQERLRWSLVRPIRNKYESAGDRPRNRGRDMSSAVMRGIILRDYGAPETLTVEELPLPVPKAHEVLVRIKSAGVNPVDWKLRSGSYKSFMPIHFPWTPGVEASGTVESVGAEAGAFKPGQAVLGMFRSAYAEFALAAAKDLVPKPERIGFDEAATISLGGLTAWKALVEDGQVAAGQLVLILGAAGGVGTFALQFARWKGAKVIATASMENAEFLRSIGAERVIDYRSKAFEKEVGEVDLVLDTVGGATLDSAYAVVKRGGLLVTVAGKPVPERAEALGIRALGSGQGPTDRLKQIVELIESGQVRLRVGASFPLHEAGKAHELGQSGHGRGRIVLHIAD